MTDKSHCRCNALFNCGNNNAPAAPRFERAQCGTIGSKGSGPGDVAISMLRESLVSGYRSCRLGRLWPTLVLTA